MNNNSTTTLAFKGLSQKSVIGDDLLTVGVRIGRRRRRCRYLNNSGPDHPGDKFRSVESPSEEPLEDIFDNLGNVGQLEEKKRIFSEGFNDFPEVSALQERKHYSNTVYNTALLALDLSHIFCSQIISCTSLIR